MGRFRMHEGDQEESNSSTNTNDNQFQSQHVYSSSEEEEEDERSGIWRGPLVPLTTHRPQHNNNNNGMDIPSPQDEMYLGGSPIEPPSVSIRRSRRRHDDGLIVDNDDMAMMQPRYYEYDPPPKPRLTWFRVVLMALIAHLLARYGPVAPPAEADSHSWEDFWVRELRGLWRSTKLIGYTVPKYVAEWVVVGLYDDVRVYYHQYQQHAQEQAELELYWANCSLTIPDEWNLEQSHTDDKRSQTDGDRYRYPIVGQSRAVEVTTKALDAWTQSAPLLLYLAGSRGTGKLELAQQISQRIFGHCCCQSEGLEDLLFRRSSSPVMMLQGRDFAIHREEEDESDSSGEDTVKQSVRALRVQLYENLLRHVQLHPNGTVVILQHAEDMAESLLATLVQDLVNPSRRASTEDELSHDYHDNSQSLASRLQQACEKTVFMLTSTIGSKTIASSIRSYGGIANIPPLELDLSLMHEVDLQFATTSTTAAASSNQKSRQSYVDVGSKFHTVAPFYPLEEPALKQILAQKAYQWTFQQSAFPSSEQFAMTENALDVLLDASRVEYLTVVKKATQEPILTFSSAGAQILKEGSPMMNAWQASMKRCFRGSNEERRPSDLGNDEIDGPISESILLDYDRKTRKGILLICPANSVHNDAHGIPTVTADRTRCEEKCRMAL